MRHTLLKIESGRLHLTSHWIRGSLLYPLATDCTRTWACLLVDVDAHDWRKCSSSAGGNAFCVTIELEVQPFRSFVARLYSILVIQSFIPNTYLSRLKGCSRSCSIHISSSKASDSTQKISNMLCQSTLIMLANDQAYAKAAMRYTRDVVITTEVLRYTLSGLQTSI